MWLEFRLEHSQHTLTFSFLVLSSMLTPALAPDPHSHCSLRLLCSLSYDFTVALLPAREPTSVLIHISRSARKHPWSEQHRGQAGLCGTTWRISLKWAAPGPVCLCVMTLRSCAEYLCALALLCQPAGIFAFELCHLHDAVCVFYGWTVFEVKYWPSRG